MSVSRRTQSPWPPGQHLVLMGRGEPGNSHYQNISQLFPRFPLPLQSRLSWLHPLLETEKERGKVDYNRSHRWIQVHICNRKIKAFSTSVIYCMSRAASWHASRLMDAIHQNHASKQEGLFFCAKSSNTEWKDNSCETGRAADGSQMRKCMWNCLVQLCLCVCVGSWLLWNLQLLVNDSICIHTQKNLQLR